MPKPDPFIIMTMGMISSLSSLSSHIGIVASAPPAVVLSEHRGNETRQQVLRHALQTAKHSPQNPVQLIVCLIEKEVSTC